MMGSRVSVTQRKHAATERARNLRQFLLQFKIKRELTPFEDFGEAFRYGCDSAPPTPTPLTLAGETPALVVHKREPDNNSTSEYYTHPCAGRKCKRQSRARP